MSSSKLYALKQEAKSARKNLDDSKRNRWEWTVLYPPIISPIFVVSVLLVITCIRISASPIYLSMSVAVTVSTGIILAISIKKAVWRSKKELTIEQEEEKAFRAYSRALTAEAEDSYGVDMTTASLRSSLLDDSTEFTAIRKGKMVDIAVRDYNGEIVFMMNGKNLTRKPRVLSFLR